jgi:hypothetical protein
MKRKNVVLARLRRPGAEEARGSQPAGRVDPSMPDLPDPRLLMQEWQALELRFAEQLTAAVRNRGRSAQTLAELEAGLTRSDRSMADAQLDVCDCPAAIDLRGYALALRWPPVQIEELESSLKSWDAAHPRGVSDSDSEAVDANLAAPAALIGLVGELGLVAVGRGPLAQVCRALDGRALAALGCGCRALRATAVEAFDARLTALLAADKYGGLGPAPGPRLSTGFLVGVFEPSGVGGGAVGVRRQATRELCDLLGGRWDAAAPTVDGAVDGQSCRRALLAAKASIGGAAVDAVSENFALLWAYCTRPCLIKRTRDAADARMRAPALQTVPAPDPPSPPFWADEQLAQDTAYQVAIGAPSDWAHCERVGRWAALGGCASAMQKFDLPAPPALCEAEVVLVAVLAAEPQQGRTAAECTRWLQSAAVAEERVRYCLLAYAGNVTAVATAAEQVAEYYQSVAEVAAVGGDPLAAETEDALLAWFGHKLRHQCALHHWLAQSGPGGRFAAGWEQPMAEEAGRWEATPIGPGHPATRQARQARAVTMAAMAAQLSRRAIRLGGEPAGQARQLAAVAAARAVSEVLRRLAERELLQVLGLCGRLVERGEHGDRPTYCDADDHAAEPSSEDEDELGEEEAAEAAEEAAQRAMAAECAELLGAAHPSVSAASPAERVWWLADDLTELYRGWTESVETQHALLARWSRRTQMAMVARSVGSVRCALEASPLSASFSLPVVGAAPGASDEGGDADLGRDAEGQPADECAEDDDVRALQVLVARYEHRCEEPWCYDRACGLKVRPALCTDWTENAVANARAPLAVRSPETESSEHHGPRRPSNTIRRH